jgi:hypothetical protein
MDDEMADLALNLLIQLSGFIMSLVVLENGNASERNSSNDIAMSQNWSSVLARFENEGGRCERALNFYQSWLLALLSF